MKPLLTAFESERDESGISSPWAEHAQLIIADVDEELADDFIVSIFLNTRHIVEYYKKHISTIRWLILMNSLIDYRFPFAR